MSRIGKKTIQIPQGVNVETHDNIVIVKGPKGENKVALHPHVKIVKADDKITVSVHNPENKADKSLWGLFRALIANQIIGVTTGFEKKLEMQGVGFKANAQGKSLVLEVGFSHPVNIEIPAGLEASIEKSVISIKGIDKELVGAFAARVRAIKKPEPYQGKGIRYVGEVVRRKAGKAAKAAGAK